MRESTRSKVVGSESKSMKMLAEQLGEDLATVSKWCTNSVQPDVKTLLGIARHLNVDVKDALSIWDSTTVNNSMSAPALLACEASARPPVALQSKELWLFQFAFYGNYTKMVTNSH